MQLHEKCHKELFADSLTYICKRSVFLDARGQLLDDILLKKSTKVPNGPLTNLLFAQIVSSDAFIGCLKSSKQFLEFIDLFVSVELVEPSY